MARRRGTGSGSDRAPPGTPFAPTDELFDAYKKDRDWPRYEERFNRLLAERRPEAEALELLKKDSICLLCAEPKADKRHRRMVAERLQSLAPVSRQTLADPGRCTFDSRTDGRN